MDHKAGIKRNITKHVLKNDGEKEAGQFFADWHKLGEIIEKKHFAFNFKSICDLKSPGENLLKNINRCLERFQASTRCFFRFDYSVKNSEKVQPTPGNS